MPAQNEIRQAARRDPEEEHPQKTRMSLLQRLANVGLGRRDEETGAADFGPRLRVLAMAPLPATAGAQAPTLGRPADGSQRAGIGICKAARAPRVGRPWPPRHLLRRRHRALTII